MKYELDMKADRAKKMLQRLASRIDDLTPVWKKFIPYWQNDIMPKTWATKGRIMGEAWPPLTEKYQKWKEKNFGGKRMMELTGKLFQAVKGGQGWEQKLKKKSLIIGVGGEKYFFHVQERSKNPRNYFFTKKKQLPNRAIAYLLKTMNNHYEEADR